MASTSREGSITGSASEYKGEAQGFNANVHAQHVAQAGGLHNHGIRVLGNPGPPGLFGFGSTTLLLSLIFLDTGSVSTQNMIVGLSLFFGGLVQIVCGMWEIACGNTFGASAFLCYGAFWISYGVIFVPSFNIAAAYASAEEFNHAIGIYLIPWFIVTVVHTIATLRTNVGMFLLFFFVSIIFLLLIVAQFVANAHIVTAAGGFGVVAAFTAYYLAAAQLLTPQQSYVRLPVGELPKKQV